MDQNDKATVLTALWLVLFTSSCLIINCVVRLKELGCLP